MSILRSPTSAEANLSPSLRLTIPIIRLFSSSSPGAFISAIEPLITYWKGVSSPYAYGINPVSQISSLSNKLNESAILRLLSLGDNEELTAKRSWGISPRLETSTERGKRIVKLPFWSISTPCIVVQNRSPPSTA